MPRFDGSGPTGQGPLTGRGLGKCVGQKPQSSVIKRGLGRRYQGAFGQRQSEPFDQKTEEKK